MTITDHIVFKNITKKYSGSTTLNDVSFSIKKGEFFSLLGPSGCGKTTLLRLLAGFEKPDSGTILLDGNEITHITANQRPINTVFQNYSLFPHLSIWENIAFGLRIAKCPRDEMQDKVEKMLKLIQMSDHAHKMPDSISGGQKQRVAIARALINQPQILLLDEPLAALDLKLRQKMLIDLDRIHDEVGITFIFVTHDQTEALGVSDRIAVLQKGSLEQIGTPVEIYETPKSTFVADFIGDTNFFNGTIVQQSEISPVDYCLLDIAQFSPILCFNDKKSIETAPKSAVETAAFKLKQGDAVILSIRPEKIQISREKPQKNNLHNLFSGTIETIVYKGDHTHFEINVSGRKILVTRQHRHFLLDEVPFTWDETVWLWWHADDGFMLEVTP